MKFIFFMLMLFMELFQIANAGPISSGGGNGYGLEFQASFESSLKNMKRHSGFGAISSLDFKALLPHLKIVVVEEILETTVGSSTQESTAVNFPSNQLIKLNKDRWASIQNKVIKEGLALHEILSLVGKEKSGDYRYSALYVSKFGVSTEDLTQSFELKRKSRSYSQNKDKYTIVATERWIQNRVFDKIRIDYKVLKNGKVLSALDRLSGSMYSCEYYGEPNLPLPEDFVEVLSDGNSEFGFLIKGLGVCGNTTSKRLHVIVPSSPDSYEAREIRPKTDPITRVTKEGLEFWFIQQEWGKCGTGGSFFVPSVFKISPPGSTYAIKTLKLPKDLKLIPVFKDFEIENFPSLFTAGLRTHDGELMELATSYFSEPEIERYTWCGLPASKAEAVKKSKAMKVLGASLDTFH